MLALVVQQFVAGAVGMAVAVAFTRAIVQGGQEVTSWHFLQAGETVTLTLADEYKADAPSVRIRATETEVVIESLSPSICIDATAVPTPPHRHR